MAQEFPLPLDAFFRAVRPTILTMDVSDPRSGMETRGGDMVSMNVGSRLWYGSFSVRPQKTFTADKMAAKASILRQAGATFLVTDGRRKGPMSDPRGEILGAASPSIQSIATNRVEVDLIGLPAGYALTFGDLFSINYASGEKYSLHRVYGDHVANGSGVAASVEVYPPLPQGVNGTPAIQLIEPVCKAVVDPQSFQPQRQGAALTTGFTLNWTQTLR